MTKFSANTNTTVMFPVRFRIYNVYAQGKKKGKPNPETFHTLTLFRNPMYESVGDTLKRAKEMIKETESRITIINPGPETDAERAARYEKNNLEIVVAKSDPIMTPAQENAADEIAA